MNDLNLVCMEDACPNCGMREMDWLVWQDDDSLQCENCGTRYTLPGVEQEGGDV